MTRTLRFGLTLSLFVAACGGAVGTDGGAGDMAPANDCPTGGVKFSEVNTQVIKLSCTFSSCHTAAAAKGGLDLETDPYKALMTTPVENVTAKGEGYVQVKPGDLTKSYLWKKLNLSMATDPKYDDRMPSASDPLDAPRMKLVRCWILGGALNN